MKRLYLVAFLVISNSSFACPNIVGTWKSSKDLTMAYNEKSGEMTEKRRVLLNQILGYITLEYTSDTVRESLANTVPVVINGKHADFEPFENNYIYQVLSCGENSLKIKSTDLKSKVEEIETLTFESADTFWASSDSIPKMREYYVRSQK